LGKHKKKVMDTCNKIVLKTCHLFGESRPWLATLAARRLVKCRACPPAGRAAAAVAPTLLVKRFFGRATPNGGCGFGNAQRNKRWVRHLWTAKIINFLHSFEKGNREILNSRRPATVCVDLNGLSPTRKERKEALMQQWINSSQSAFLRPTADRLN
jgi:hypothetical protein